MQDRMGSPQCEFVENGPIRCDDDAKEFVEHRYGAGWYCEPHADVVQNKWVPARPLSSQWWEAS
jgi:hypothetical protein